MRDNADQVAALLHQVAETHHVVCADTGGEDPDWATFSSDWLLHSSALAKIPGAEPVRGHLTAAPVSLDGRHLRTEPDERWEDYCARALIERFSAWKAAA
jgi:hypothetical protein